MNSNERDEVVYKMRKQLESLSELPLHNDSFFSNIKQANPLQTQFNIWKRNLFVPLTDQLEEKAKRKIQEIEDLKKLEKEKETVWFEGKRDMYDPDHEEKRLERHQAILKQHLAEERKKQGLDVNDDYEKVTPEYEKDPMKDSVDSLPVKRKQKWRIW